MVFKDMLEYERSIRFLHKKFRDKPKGYVTELKINGYAFCEMKSPKIEIILLDPNQRMVAYRPAPNPEIHDNGEKWFFGDYQKAVEDAFSWINKKDEIKNGQSIKFQENKNDLSPEYTLMGFF